MKQTRSLSDFSCLSEYTRLYPINAIKRLWGCLHLINASHLGYQSLNGKGHAAVTVSNKEAQWLSGRVQN